jgi:RNA polymerase sigma-70 factor (ECF subfamily)
MLRSREDAEEISSRAMQQVFRMIASFRGDCLLKTWVWRITRNLALNRLTYFRSRRRNDHLSIDYRDERGVNRLDDVLLCQGMRPQSHAELSDLEEHLMAAREFLSPNQRRIIALSQDEHLDYGQLAAKLGIPQGSVKSRLSRARSQLKTALTDIQRGRTPVKRRQYIRTAAGGRVLKAA